MRVHRIHIRPYGGEASLEETFAYCLKQGVLGIGWRLASGKTEASWEEYLAEAQEIFKDARDVHKDFWAQRYIKDQVKPGDLVWTRDTQGNYYLAKVLSGWEYWMHPEAVEKGIDIANIFRVTFRPVDLDAVPGKIIASFRAARTIQGINSPPTVEYTKFLWNKLAGHQEYRLDEKVASDPFELLDDEETEDLVFLYLQDQGWYVVPGSRKGDTMRYEFYVVHPKTGERGMVQVKTGNTPLDRNAYASAPGTVFLFQPHGRYLGEEKPNVRCLTRDELLGFVERAYAWLPKRHRFVMDLHRELSGN
ncbi:MAG: hypothetical protein RMI36_11365 [Thermus sp.]|uniref:hypothetical protein n=1 Tax=Thermus sp. TaxID=275 RepID=UPI00298EFADD|nr:hypothetical protein [Thermus sp.]MDW8018412.1 hypothetical protein [Thermus sp.]